MSTLRVSTVSLGFCSRHSWICHQLQRSGLKGLIIRRTCAQNSLGSHLPSSQTRGIREIFSHCFPAPLLRLSRSYPRSTHTHNRGALQKLSRKAVQTPLLRQLRPTGTPYLSSLCHWELEVARTCEKGEAGSEGTLGRYSSRAGSVCVSMFGICFGVEATKFSSLSAQYTVTRHTWPDWMRSLLINLEQLVAYLGFEHTLDAWYRHTSSTNSGRPGTILSSTIDYLQGIHHRPGMSCPLATALLSGGHCTWLLVRIYVFLHLKVWKLKTHSGPVRRLFVPLVGAREDWQRIRLVRVRSGAGGRSGER